VWTGAAAQVRIWKCPSLGQIIQGRKPQSLLSHTAVTFDLKHKNAYATAFLPKKALRQNHANFKFRNSKSAIYDKTHYVEGWVAGEMMEFVTVFCGRKGNARAAAPATYYI
jgi:hypothetical protein